MCLHMNFLGSGVSKNSKLLIIKHCKKKGSIYCKIFLSFGLKYGIVGFWKIKKKEPICKEV